MMPIQNSAEKFSVYFGESGLTLTTTLSKAGASFSSVAPTITDASNGYYIIAPLAAHRDTLGVNSWLFVSGDESRPYVERVESTDNAAILSALLNVTNAGIDLAEGEFLITIPIEGPSGSPISGAKVTIQDGNGSPVRVAQSSGSGVAKVGLPSGTYTLVVSGGTTYQSYSEEIVIIGTREIPIDLELAPSANPLDDSSALIYRRSTATDWEIPFKIGDLSGSNWHQLLVTAKVSPFEDDDDNAAVFQIRKLRVPDGGITEGLLVLEGNAYPTEAHATVTIDDMSTGEGRITILAAANKSINPTNQRYWESEDNVILSQQAYRRNEAIVPPVLHCDVKRLDGDGKASPDRHQMLLVVTQSVTQTVV